MRMEFKKQAANLISRMPVYPHWLEFRQGNLLREQIIHCLSGNVLEVGAGEGRLKREAVLLNKKILKYVATDYSTWDSAFVEGSKLATGNRFFDFLFLKSERSEMDRICSALDLPFENESFDWHVSSEVLEHVDDPNAFFAEAARVLRSGGGLVLTAPFLYRAHPDLNSDFFRILPAGYHAIAKKYSFKVEQIVSNTGVGATCAALLNQKIIRLFLEAPKISFTRLILFLVMAPLFLLFNLSGFLVDSLALDSRFATRYLVVLRKN